MSARCAVCSRDLARYGYSTGNTLDGFEAVSNLCKDCNDRHLRAQGMGQLADRIAIQDRGIDLFWTSIKWIVIAVVAIGIVAWIAGI